MGLVKKQRCENAEKDKGSEYIDSPRRFLQNSYWQM